jgi:hypothetical protein
MGTYLQNLKLVKTILSSYLTENIAASRLLVGLMAAMFLRNVGLAPNYIASQPRRP